MAFIAQTIFLALVTQVSAQYGPGGRYGPGGGGRGRYGNDDDGDGQFGNFGPSMSNRQGIIIAHGVLAALAFVIFFPLGSILIRLGSFRGSWLVHGLFQIFAYVIYSIAFGIGVYIIGNVLVDLIHNYHPTIGIIVFVLLFFQPLLGLMHHFKFKKYNCRTVWSYGHLWLGRVVITLGIINGGLGMLLATETGRFAPSQGQIAAYAVVAAIMWLAWVAASVYGEMKRSRSRNAVTEDNYKSEFA